MGNWGSETGVKGIREGKLTRMRNWGRDSENYRDIGEGTVRRKANWGR